jgi:ribonuclease J
VATPAARAPKPVHALLLEGTRLSRAEQHNTSEQEVEEALAELCGQTPGMVLAFYSGQNIDRLVTVFRACKRSRRTLVLDLYGAVVAAATQRPTIPQASWDGVDVFVPNAQRRRVIESNTFDDINAARPHRVFPEQLASRASGMVLTMRGSMTGEIERAGCLKDAAAAWSMWPGYLDRPSGQRVRDWLDTHEIPLTVLHASGHASVSDLRHLAEAVDPQRVVPIHTAVPERYSELFERVEPHGDGEWWSV